MKKLSEKILEVKQQKEYRGNWEFFNTMVTNIKLKKDDYMRMFDNLSDEEIAAWIKLVQLCYKGSDEQDEADRMQNQDDLAAFYAKHPIEE